MNMHVKTTPRLRPVVMPIPLMRAQAAGEFVQAHGLPQDDVDVIQRGVALKLIKTIHIYGINAYGHAVDRNEMSFDWSNANGEITLHIGDHMTVTEAVDEAFAAAVDFIADKLARQRLTPELRFGFVDEISADPARKAAAQRDLGCGSQNLPQWAPGTRERQVLRVSPGRDRGLTISHSTALKR